MSVARAWEVESERERLVRQQHCPNCGAGPGRRCAYGQRSEGSRAHVGRYDLAAQAGRVPALTPAGRAR